jgi:ABC-type nitrate/sulfonate/bicarbonate transport system permease component
MHPLERVARVVLLPLLVALWEAAGRLGWISPQLLGVPSTIVARAWADVATGRLLPHLAITVGEMTAGFAAGTVAGIVCGLLFARRPLVGRALMPYLAAVYSIPRPALAPLFVLWFGVGFVSKVLLVVTLVYFVFLRYVLAGMATIDTTRLHWVMTLGASPWQATRLVAVRCVLPWLFAATKVALALALVGAIVGEFISARAGLGFLLVRAAEDGDTVGVLSGTLVLAVLVVAIVVPLGRLERHLFRWQAEARV